MAERDLPSIAELAGAIPDAAPSLGQQLRQAEADLRDCRSRLAALVEEERTAYSGGVRATAAMDAALQWLAQHPEAGHA